MKILKKITAVMTAAVLMFSVSTFPVAASELSNNSPVIVEENNSTIISEGDSLSVEEEAVADEPAKDNTEEAVDDEPAKDNTEEAVDDEPAGGNTGGDNQFRIYYYVSGSLRFEEDKTTSDTTFENIYDSLKFEIEETIETKITSDFVYDVKTVNYEEWLPSTSIQNLRVDIEEQYVATVYSYPVKKVWENLEQPFTFYITDEEGYPIDFYKIEILNENDEVLEEVYRNPKNQDGLLIKTEGEYSVEEQYYVNVYFDEWNKYNEQKLPIESTLFQRPDSIHATIYQHGSIVGQVNLNSSNSWSQSFSTTTYLSDITVKENTTGQWDYSYSIEQSVFGGSTIILTNKLTFSRGAVTIKVPVGQNIPDSGNPGLPVMVVLIFIGTSLFLGSYYIVTKKK